MDGKIVTDLTVLLAHHSETWSEQWGVRDEARVLKAIQAISAAIAKVGSTLPEHTPKHFTPEKSETHRKHFLVKLLRVLTVGVCGSSL